MPTLTFRWRIAGVLTDLPSVPLLSDPTGAFGVRRNDTAATVVADATPMVHAGTGVYTYTFAAPAPSLEYSWWAEVAYTGNVYHFEREFADGGGVVIPVGGWRYSDRAHVVALVGNDAVNVVWSLDGDNLEDVGLMEQDGIQADTYIDRALMLEGLTVPINTGTASAVVVQSLADIGAHLTVWWGFHHRGLEELSGRGLGSADDISGLMSGYKKYADEELEKLATILQRIDTDDSVLPSGSLAGAITAVVGPPKQYPGTGSVRPAAFVVPSFPSGIGSW
jgi:hypothetical protein